MSGKEAELSLGFIIVNILVDVTPDKDQDELSRKKTFTCFLRGTGLADELNGVEISVVASQVMGWTSYLCKPTKTKGQSLLKQTDRELQDTDKKIISHESH